MNKMYLVLVLLCLVYVCAVHAAPSAISVAVGNLESSGGRADGSSSKTNTALLNYTLTESSNKQIHGTETDTSTKSNNDPSSTTLKTTIFTNDTARFFDKTTTSTDKTTTSTAKTTTSTDKTTTSTDKTTTSTDKTTTSTDKTTTSTDKPSTSTDKPSTSTSKTTTSTLSPSTSSTPKPSPSDGGFSPSSFLGGFILGLGLLAIAYVVYKFYKTRGDLSYRTL